MRAELELEGGAALVRVCMGGGQGTIWPAAGVVAAVSLRQHYMGGGGGRTCAPPWSHNPTKRHDSDLAGYEANAVCRPHQPQACGACLLDRVPAPVYSAPAISAVCLHSNPAPPTTTPTPSLHAAQSTRLACHAPRRRYQPASPRPHSPAAQSHPAGPAGLIFAPSSRRPESLWGGSEWKFARSFWRPHGPISRLRQQSS